MRHVRSLNFDALEERKLLSRAHAPVIHRAAVAPVSLVLNGTLTIDNSAATSNMDENSDTITTTPVSGVLGALGEVHGTWTESVDSFGDYLPPDTIQLRNAQGTFTIAFNNNNTGTRHKIAHGAVSYSLPQRLYPGMGAYAKASETGTIALNTNALRTGIMSMTLVTTSK